MRFEGLDLRGPDGVRAALEGGRATRPEDEHPWAWAERLCAASPQGARWVDEALVQMVRAAAAGEALVPDDRVAACFGLAERCRLSGLTELWLAALRAGTVAVWSDPQAARFLGWGVGLPHLALEPDEAARAAALGRRPGCFADALSLLGDAAPRAAAELVVSALGDALAAGESEALEEAAALYVYRADDELRARMAGGLAAESPEVLGALRGAVAGEARRFAGGRAQPLVEPLDAALAGVWGEVWGGAPPAGGEQAPPAGALSREVEAELRRAMAALDEEARGLAAHLLGLLGPRRGGRAPGADGGPASPQEAALPFDPMRVFAAYVLERGLATPGPGGVPTVRVDTGFLQAHGAALIEALVAAARGDAPPPDGPTRPPELEPDPDPEPDPELDLELDLDLDVLREQLQALASALEPDAG